MNLPGEKKRRLFFALWPDNGVRVKLLRVAREYVRRPPSAANLHMTLVFLGDCTEQQLSCSRAAVAGLEAPMFELEMDYLGAFPRAGIQWLGLGSVPAQLPQLVAQLQQALTGCGFEPEKRRFVPHITLARKVRKPLVRAGLEAIHWPVRDFVLAESVSVSGGVEYRVLDRWPLK